MPSENFEKVISMLQKARYPVAFTGAGMSAESGIPTFRDSPAALWDEFDAKELSSAEGFNKYPERVFGWHVWLMAQIQHASPHKGHKALSDMQAIWPNLKIVTQNVDNLHERAGNTNVFHLHGDIFALRCSRSNCRRPYTGFTIPDDARFNPELTLQPPQCTCGALVRHHVVFFGENLPAKPWKAAHSAMLFADVVLVIGTSGVVYPAASLVKIAKEQGAFIIEINPKATDLSLDTNLSLFSGAADTLDLISKRLIGYSAPTSS